MSIFLLENALFTAGVLIGILIGKAYFCDKQEVNVNVNVDCVVNRNTINISDIENHGTIGSLGNITIDM